jgi:hypothetical protein
MICVLVEDNPIRINGKLTGIHWDTHILELTFDDGYIVEIPAETIDKVFDIIDVLRFDTQVYIKGFIRKMEV